MQDTLQWFRCGIWEEDKVAIYEMFDFVDRSSSVGRIGGTHVLIVGLWRRYFVEVIGCLV